MNVDLRGYLGVGGSAVLALGGGGARQRTGDSLAAVSAEARLPLTSPLSVGRVGVTAFVDADTA